MKSEQLEIPAVTCSSVARPYKVCIVIPAGRKRYLELLVPHILSQPGWDELRFWLNTSDPLDIAYINSLQELDARIKVEQSTCTPRGNRTIGQFFKNCVDEKTVYIRFDDDIVFVEKNLIENIARFRWENKEPFLISPVVINNALMSFLLKCRGKIRTNEGLSSYCMDRVGWRSGMFAERLHQGFIEMVRHGRIAELRCGGAIISLSRFSINCIAFLGQDFSSFGGHIPPEEDEEEYLSVLLPLKMDRVNYFWGDGVVAHFAFFTQREYLDATDILSRYRNLTKLYIRG